VELALAVICIVESQQIHEAGFDSYMCGYGECSKPSKQLPIHYVLNVGVIGAVGLGRWYKDMNRKSAITASLI